MPTYASSAVAHHDPDITTIAVTVDAANGIRAHRQGRGELRSLQSHHADIG